MAASKRVAFAAVLVALALLGTAAPGNPAQGAAPVPKVVLVVGPVGALTGTYRRLANEAAAAARASGAQVVKVYSPDATWPLVRQAMTGASIVVYLGHGNGWPSRYRTELYPPSQDGFGLNPIAGVDDSAHQYFGESSIDDVRLARNAVVILSHLCYASGNSEPGLDEGPVDVAVQRVDNYAAGFLRAGARAVVAEGHFGPAYYVRQLLQTSRSIERIWAASPAAHGHAFGVPSARTPGYTLHLDPDRARSGFYRSLVSRGVSGAEVRAGSSGDRSVGASASAMAEVPTLAGRGAAFGDVRVTGQNVGGTRATLQLPRSGPPGAIPGGTELGVRWDPIELDPLPQPVTLAPPAPAMPPPASPGSAATSDAPSGTALPSDVGAQAALNTGKERPAPDLPEFMRARTPDLQVLGEPPAIDLVAPERLGALVDLVPVRLSKSKLSASVTYPAEPGLYRLVVTLHTAAGVAYDAATQAMLQPMIVRVRPAVSVAFGLAGELAAPSDSLVELPVRVHNAGTQRWERALRGGLITRLAPRLTATWLSPDARPVPAPAEALLDPDRLGPGEEQVVTVLVTTPPMDGNYLLVVDVLSPEHGSLAARGSQPGIVRVHVVPDGSTSTSTPTSTLNPTPTSTLNPSLTPSGEAMP